MNKANHGNDDTNNKNNLDTVKNNVEADCDNELDSGKMTPETIAKEDTILVSYNDSYKQKVFDFTDRCFDELGKKFDPSGRHYFYNDIENYFVVFYCLLYQDRLIGTAALKIIKSALKLYEKTGFKNTERYNDNMYADVFMRLDL